MPATLWAARDPMEMNDMKAERITKTRSALAAICVAALTGCHSQPARDGKTGCLVDAARPLTVLAIDTSESLTLRQKDLVQLLASKTWEQVPNEGELRIYTLDGRAAEVLPRLQVCRGPQFSPLESPKSRQFKDHNDREDAKATQVTALAHEIVTGSGVGSVVRGSRIFEFVSSIGSHSQGLYTARTVILVSDMKQFSPRYASNGALPQQGLDLAGIALNVVVLGDGAPLPHAWARLIEHSGAASVEVALETLPTGLAR